MHVAINGLNLLTFKRELKPELFYVAYREQLIVGLCHKVPLICL